MGAKQVLGQLGTFDVENYGDLLYPFLLDRMLLRRNEQREVRGFSLTRGSPVRGSNCHTRPVRELFSGRSGSAYTLITGGGEILRCDWDLVASHYRGRSLVRRVREALSKGPRFLRFRLGGPERDDARFRQRFMS